MLLPGFGSYLAQAYLSRASSAYIANPVNRALDKIYGGIVHLALPHSKLVDQFYAGGWGDLMGVVDADGPWWDDASFDYRGLHRKVMDVPLAPPTCEWKTIDRNEAFSEMEVTFPTPATGRLYDWLPEESRQARARVWLPAVAGGRGVGSPRACALMLAGTGEHGYGRRRVIARHLIAQGVAAMALESPYYGARKPAGQRASKLKHVADLLALGKATILEARDLLKMLQVNLGIERLAVCGLSMGGVHASMVAALHPEDVACIPMLAPFSASVPYVEPGMLGRACAWETLGEQQLPSGGAGAMGGGGDEGVPGQGDRSIADVRRTMARVLQVTDVTRYPVPRRTDAAIVVGADGDEYVPPDTVQAVHEAWPGSELRWVMAGHVSAHVFRQREFSRAIEDSLSRL